MKAYTLIMETLLRKRYISVVHICWLLSYAAIFPLQPPEEWTWGAFVFGWSGCLLPLLISGGIFGDDIASGRISLLVTKPIHALELYLYRLLGLLLQGTIHLTAVGIVIFGLHRLTGYGSVRHLMAWLLAAWLVFNTWVALSASISIVVQRERNTMLLFLAAPTVYLLVASALAFFPEATGTKLLVHVVRYGCPPVELFVGLARMKHSFVRALGDVGHSLILTAGYAALGIYWLKVREFKRATD